MDLVCRNTRIVPLNGGSPGEPVDIGIEGARIVAVGSDLQAAGTETIDAEGRWAIPGLWDQHIHLGQVALQSGWLTTPATADVDEILALVAGQPNPPGGVLMGLGHRVSSFTREATTAALDQAVGDRPVVLVSGDVHSGWLSSAAQRLLGVSYEGLVAETPWFALLDRLTSGEKAEAEIERALPGVLASAAALGVTGIVDLSMAPNHRLWVERATPLRIRAGFYAEHLEDVLALDLRSGDPLGRSGLATLGPLKVIADGSLGSMTAACEQPYGPGSTYGVVNATTAELTAWAARAAAQGIEVAFHAIGDRAIASVLTAMTAAGARGSVEHAQLLPPGAARQMAKAGIAASVQPAHLVDDIPALDRVWADRGARAFAFGDLVRAGVDVRFGSDAPVAPLDPWLAMAAAVHRAHPDDDPWHPEQRLSAAEALAASVNGGRITVGRAADIVLLDADPLRGATSAESAAHLRAMPPAACTIVAGVVRHQV